MEVGGVVGVFEGQKAGVPLRRHLLGAKRFLPWAYLVVFVVAVIGAPILVDRWFPGWSLLGVVLISIPSLYLWLRYCRRSGPKAWLARGVPPESHVTFQVAETALVIAGSLSETRLAWAGISQITREKTYWLFIGPGAAYFLPIRFFADRAAEMDFLRACLAHLSPEAQARSAKAAALLA